MRAFTCTLLLLLILINAAPAHARRAQDEPRRFLDAKLVPATARSLNAFVPRGWKLEGQADGDLNVDGIPDAALQLIEDLPLESAEGVPNERRRALVVVFKKAGGTYERAAVATRLLYCSTCGGMLSDPAGGNLSLDIKRGILNVNQLSGAREAVEVTQRFRYDAQLKRFILIGEDIESYDRAVGDGTKESANYLTGIKVIEKRKVKKEGADPVLVSTRKVKVPTSKRFIENMDYEK